MRLNLVAFYITTFYTQRRGKTSQDRLLEQAERKIEAWLATALVLQACQ